MEHKARIEGNFIRSINFAMQQNYVPLIRNLIIKNETGENLSRLDLKIRFEPDFANEYHFPIEDIPPGQSVEISPVRIQLKTDYLFSLTEKILGAVTMELFQGQENLCSRQQEIELLTADQWSGLLFMPEIIAAFATPNLPCISQVLREASGFLEIWSKSPSFTGYQTRNPNHVKLQMAAIYEALRKKNIAYMNPPATYESVGQRIRLPHVVLGQKQGTCLDLSLLYGACLEAAGLFPLLLFIQGHAFCGCWLEEETFADCVTDDMSAIEKRTASGAEEMLLVECTDFVSGRTADFDKAVKHGKDHLASQEDFICAIDIQRTRGSGIRPIPLPLLTLDTEADQTEERQNSLNPQAPSALDHSLMGRVTEGAGEPLTKQKLWQRKLLDFSLRNTLLNFRATKNAFQLMVSDLCQLEDQLSDGKDFRILEMPSEWTVTLRDSHIFEIETEKDLISTIAAEEFKSSRIRTFLSEAELDKNLKGLYRSARVSMEENGSNTLFLALGFLRWFESDLSEKARYAPLVLVPVDIVRNVRSKGFVIRSRQEETQMNVTLLEYLRQDHGILISGLDPLPEDEHGVDLPLVFHTIRQAVMAKKRWNVEEMAFLGLFSFGQFVMWNDIRSRSSEIEKNKVVSGLIEGKMNWDPGTEHITAENLDRSLSLADMAVPVSADSSQMVAIAAAAAGQSFVLHGPPGTGKSQTITNMIANALYQGKSVLFVAEKMAALNVVQKRLADIGLDPFCLELHSNKTVKSSVLAKLDRTLETGRIRPPQDHLETAEKIHGLRAGLNILIEALHEKRAYGSSLYQSIELLERYKDYRGTLSFSRESLKSLDQDRMAQWEQLIRQYMVAIKELGVYTHHPLLGYEGKEYSIELKETFQKELRCLLARWDQAAAHQESLYSWAGGITDRSRRMTDRLVSAARAALLTAPALTSLLDQPDFRDLSDRLHRLIDTGKEYNQIRHRIEEQFESSVLTYGAESASLQWKQAGNRWFLPRTLARNKLVKELRLYAKYPQSVTKDNMEALYGDLCLLQARKREILETPPQLTGLLSGMYMELSTDWDSLEKAVAKAAAVEESCSRFNRNDRRAVMEAIRRGDEDILTGHVDTLTEFLEETDGFLTRWQIRPEICNDTEEHWLSDLGQILSRYLEHLDELRNKTIFNQADDALIRNGLETVSTAYKDGRISNQDLVPAFTADLNYELALMTIAGDSRLASFHGKQYDDMIIQYRELVSRYQQLTIQELAARLSARIPVPGGTNASSSELGILKKAIRNNGRMMSLRKLFDQIPTLLRKLCPCMLMSPLSVAQYIDPSFPKFDLVIFDEASQLPTSEAVGTIARGENVVVVGDPKQLPPTNFFSSNRIDEENSDKEDLESLLDDCLAISMPQESLKWHYRSRHESLIAYSNRKYYDNKLYTFPSPRDLASEVKLVCLDGFYDKGKTKQNRAEAQAIVAEVVRRLKDERLRSDSLGVVTFSSAQQNLIDDMLFEEFRKHPELEEWDRNSKEPVFIKNLENVQGDERDVILFSVGYGPDSSGNVSMNFGPLNRDGGWRRLNVAISRARKSMIVYSVLRPEQIDLARTRSEGVAGLKGFLEFAATGQNTLARKAEAGSRKEDYLIPNIARAIEAMGYKAVCNIGSSRFKIDIGVVDPRQKDTYLLGILLDGENCRKTATARDKFLLQPSVLQGLGWNVIRVWTLDWLDDPDRVLREIREILETLPGRQEEDNVSQDTFAPLEQLEKMEEEEFFRTAKAPYVSFRPPLSGTPEEFYLPRSQSKIVRLAQKILEQESPVSRKLLMKKVLGAWGITRSGARVENIFSDAMRKIKKSTTRDEDREFFWKKDQNPNEFAVYRPGEDEDSRRSMDDIPSEEILIAAAEVLREQVSLPRPDLIRETAKKFGFSRRGNVIESTISYAIEKGIDRGRLLVLENGNIALPVNF